MSGRLRLAICGDGRSPHTQRWANAFAERGHDVAVIWRRDQLVPSATAGYVDTVQHDVVGGELEPRKPWREAGARRDARALARRLRPDLVHGLYLQQHGWTAHDLGIHPLVLSALGSDVVRLESDPPAGLRSRVVERYARGRTLAAVRAADVLLCDSTDVSARLERLAPGTQTEIVRFGVEPPAPDDAGWRARLELASDDFVVLSSRLFKPNYNIHVIIESLPRLLASVPTAVLVLKEFEPFSDPVYRARCFELVDQLELRRSVRVVGELDPHDLRSLYAAADVYVSVPSADATAVSIFEAMAARVPVVASRASGIDPQILRDGETALLVEPGDAAGLAQALTGLAEDPVGAGRIAEHGYAIYERLGSAASEFDRAETIYRELVARRGG
ncbi:MAG TPA: glycosyltransferase family 4 protein [Gaiellaceae bacterium]|nr:glycosyltransferase family 4 protein [Gaiellaceae bacterium]